MPKLESSVFPSYMDADINLNALLASSSGDPATVSDLIVPSPPPSPPPAHDAEAGSPDSVTS
jgi:hypothetical protein